MSKKKTTNLTRLYFVSTFLFLSWSSCSTAAHENDWINDRKTFAGSTLLQNPGQPASAETRHRRCGHGCHRRYLWHFQQWSSGQIWGECELLRKSFLNFPLSQTHRIRLKQNDRKWCGGLDQILRIGISLILVKLSGMNIKMINCSPSDPIPCLVRGDEHVTFDPSPPALILNIKRQESVMTRLLVVVFGRWSWSSWWLTVSTTWLNVRRGWRRTRTSKFQLPSLSLGNKKLGCEVA